MKSLALIALLIGLISLGVRLVFLDSIPANFQPDAVDTLRTFISSPQHHSLPWYGVNWNGASAINTYLIGASWQLFGESLFGIRFPAALFSTCALLLLFFIGYQITKKRLLSGSFALALSTNTWFLNFSRSGWENIFNAVSLLLVAFGLYTFIHNKQYRLAVIMLIAGSVLGFYFYHPGKLFFPVSFGILFLISIVTIRIRTEWKWLLLYLVMTMILISPHVFFIVSQPERSLGRMQTVSIAQADSSFSAITHMKKNIIGPFTFQKELFMHDNWSRYISPDEHPIHPLITIFFLIGFVVSIVKYPCFPLLYVGTIVPIGLLSLQSPNAARTVHMVPFVFLFALIGCNALISYGAARAQHNGNLVRSTLVNIMCIVLLILSAVQFQWYWTWIQRPDVLQSREPAIAHEEYQQWLEFYKNEVRQQRDPNVSEWQEVMK